MVWAAYERNTEKCGAKAKPRWTKRCRLCWKGLRIDSPMLIDTLREQCNGLKKLDEQIARIEQRLHPWMQTDQAAKSLTEIQGVGMLTATAAVATMGNARACKSGRAFAAWVGLVPKQTGSGGKVRLLGISKRGDTDLRTLLIHGARSVLTRAKAPGRWVEQLLKRWPLNVVSVALANKRARI